MCHDVILELVYGVNQLCDLNPPTWTPSNECNCCILWPRLKLLWLVDGPGWPPSVLGKLEVSLGCSTELLGLRSPVYGPSPKYSNNKAREGTVPRSLHQVDNDQHEDRPHAPSKATWIRYRTASAASQKRLQMLGGAGPELMWGHC